MIIAKQFLRECKANYLGVSISNSPKRIQVYEILSWSQTELWKQNIIHIKISEFLTVFLTIKTVLCSIEKDASLYYFSSGSG